MAAHRQRELSVAGTLDDGVGLNESFNVISNCSCFQTATRVVSLVRISLAVKVFPSMFFHPMKV